MKPNEIKKYSKKLEIALSQFRPVTGYLSFWNDNFTTPPTDMFFIYGLLIDIQGLLEAAVVPGSYLFLFDWLCHENKIGLQF